MADTRPPTPARKTALAPDVRRLDERAARAWTERMAVRRLPDGRYAVESESGATYVVDLDDHACTCPDHQIRGAVCKHLRRVAIEISTHRVPPPGERRATCAACGVETFVSEADHRDSPDTAHGGDGPVSAPADAAPPLCADCLLEPGDVALDRETDDRLVVVRVRPERADAVRVGPEDRLVADYETNAGYPTDDPVVEAVYLGQYADADPTRYSFPLSRLERVDDAALVE